MADTEAHWYVAHTYSGYENKVKMDIEKTIENRNLQDQIFEVSVPMLNVVEEKKDEQKTVQKKMFPAYVLINMIMNDDTWYVVRNTRGVTGFVGPGSKPVPLTDAEMASMGLKVDAPNVPFGKVRQVLCVRLTTKREWLRSVLISSVVRHLLSLVSTMLKQYNKAQNIALCKVMCSSIFF